MKKVIIQLAENAALMTRSYNPGLINAAGFRPRRRSSSGCYFWVATLTLPDQVGVAFALIKQFDVCGTSHVYRSWKAAASKLKRALGWAWSADWAHPDEKPFTDAIREDPAGLANWAAYADFLQEMGRPRGRVIAGWLAGPALKRKRTRP